MCLPMMAVAQEKNDSVEKKSIEITTNFNMAGKAILLAKSTTVERSDFKALEWELTNQTVGDENFITLKVINKKTGRIEEIKHWKDGAHLLMEVDEKKQTSYTVYDDAFTHLRIIGMPLGNAIMLFSTLRNKE